MAVQPLSMTPMRATVMDFPALPFHTDEIIILYRTAQANDGDIYLFLKVCSNMQHMCDIKFASKSAFAKVSLCHDHYVNVT